MRLSSTTMSLSPTAVAWNKLPEFDGHEMVIGFNDRESGLKGYVGIHSTALGPALGGTRLQIYKSDTAALCDALNLSRAMSYKCALAGLPYGGGKGVIYLRSGQTFDREALLTVYARVVQNLRGLFQTGTDVGVTDADVHHMAKTTEYMLGVSAADRGNLTTANCAALGVFYAIRAALKVLYGSDDPNGRTVAIKGVGKLGGELARLLHEAGAKVTVADVNQANLDKLKKLIPGIQVVDVPHIHRREVDVYAPCALGNEFNTRTVQQLRCKVVVGGANNQLANAAAGHRLHKRNILYVPDYIANAGGLIYVADELEQGGFSQQRVLERVRGIEATVRDILERSVQTSLPPGAVADSIAEERMGRTW